MANVNGKFPRDDSSEADLFRLLIGDLSLGRVIRQAREEFLKQELPQLLQAAMELHKVAGPVNAPAIGNKQSNARRPAVTKNGKTAKNADDLGKMKEATFLEGPLEVD